MRITEFGQNKEIYFFKTCKVIISIQKFLWCQMDARLIGVIIS